MIEMCMRYRNRLQLQSMFVDRANNFPGIVTGIDTYCLPAFFAAKNACVLLESRNCDFFDDHRNWRLVLSALYFVDSSLKSNGTCMSASPHRGEMFIAWWCFLYSEAP